MANRVRFFSGFCFLVLAFSAKIFCGDADMAQKIGIIPFACLGGISAGDAAMLGESIKSKLAGLTGIDIVDKKNIREAMTESRIDSSVDCSSVDCLAGLGKKLDAQIMISGSLGKIGELYDLSLTVVNAVGRKRLFTKEYRLKGAVESFFTKISGEAVDDIVLSLHNQPVKPQPVESIPARTREPQTVELAPIEEISITALNYEKEQSRPIQGPTFGGSGRLALGQMGQNESRWGVGLFYLQPTTSNGYFRIKASMPISDNDSIRLHSDNSMQDVLTSIEHEWSWEFFGVGAGIAYMYMHSFNERYTGSAQYNPTTGSYDYYPSPIHFNVQSAFNWVCDIRGGRPNKGFRGRIVWPMPWINLYNTDTPANYFIEYSALGVFGGDFIKGAIGIQGMYKQRASNTTFDPNYSYESSINVDSYYAMVPCGKIAFRVGKQAVVCATLDMTGIFVPPLSGSSSQWAPNIQISYTYSLRPLTALDVGDGTF
jgi:hypothetical protein